MKNLIEERYEIVKTYAETALDANSNSIYDAISDLKALIILDKFFVLWNEEATLQKGYELLGRIYNSIDKPRDAVKAFENSQRILERGKYYDQNEYLKIEYGIGLCYKALKEATLAKEHLQNVVERYQEWFQDSPEGFDEKASREFFLRAYCLLGIEQYLEGDYETAFNTFGLVHASILELAHWDFASYRYDSVEPLLLLLSSEYAAKSAGMLGDEEQKYYFERKHEIYSYLIDYKEKNLQSIYDLAF